MYLVPYINEGLVSNFQYAVVHEWIVKKKDKNKVERKKNCNENYSYFHRGCLKSEKIQSAVVCFFRHRDSA